MDAEIQVSYGNVCSFFNKYLQNFTRFGKGFLFEQCFVHETIQNFLKFKFVDVKNDVLLLKRVVHDLQCCLAFIYEKENTEIEKMVYNQLMIHINLFVFFLFEIMLLVVVLNNF